MSNTKPDTLTLRKGFGETQLKVSVYNAKWLRR